MSKPDINIFIFLFKKINIILPAFLFFSYSHVHAASMIFSSGLESGTLSGFKPHVTGGLFAPTKSPVAAGKYAAKFHLANNTSENTYRAETQLANEKGSFKFNTEYWFSMDYMYSDWQKDYSAEIAPFQLHRVPSDWSKPCGGQVAAVGAAPFLMLSKDNVAQIVLYGGKTAWSGPIVINKWQNIVFHFDIGWDNNGYVEAWKDGVKLFKKEGKLHDQLDLCGKPWREPTFNVGIYKWDWKKGRPATQSKYRTLHVDNFKVAQGSGGFSTMADINDSKLASNEEKLVAHWPMNQAKDTVLTDASGNGYKGKLVNGAKLTASGGVRFDGVNDYVDVGTPDVAGHALTLSAWVRSDDLANCSARDCRIIAKATSLKKQDHDFMISTIKVGSKTRLRFRLNTKGKTSTLIADSGDVHDHEWFHVAAVYDGKTMRLYKDGFEVGRKAKTGAITPRNVSSVWIGGSPLTAKSRPWKGQIDDVRIYNQALSDAEIRELAR